MLRTIIKIDEDKCNGCGLCVTACHEGAIGLVDGKAKLLREDYCDGLGDCLPACPTRAITFEKREAAAYDEAAVKAAAKAGAESGAASATNAADIANADSFTAAANAAYGINTAASVSAAYDANTDASATAEANTSPAGHENQPPPLPCGCPGTQSKTIKREAGEPSEPRTAQQQAAPQQAPPAQTQLNQWPVQIKLVPQGAAYFQNANLLVAADCAAYAYGNFHAEYMKNKITIIGCPKLDDCDYSEKLTAILKANDIKSVTVVRMEVPCCGGIENAVKTALRNCGKMIPWQIVTISTDGRILAQ